MLSTEAMCAQVFPKDVVATSILVLWTAWYLDTETGLGALNLVVLALRLVLVLSRGLLQMVAKVAHRCPTPVSVTPRSVLLIASSVRGRNGLYAARLAVEE